MQSAKNDYLHFSSLLQPMSTIFSLCLLVFIISCNKDDGLKTANKFTYQGKEYALDKGYIHKDETVEGPWSYTVLLFPATVTVSSNGGTGYQLSGVDDGSNIGLHSPTESEISPGVYQWPTMTTPGSHMIGGGFAYIIPSTATTMGGTERGFEYGYGTVTVSKQDSEHTIKFSLKLVEAYGGGTLEGQFTGELGPYL
jgi:hypothetical protein